MLWMMTRVLVLTQIFSFHVTTPQRLMSFMTTTVAHSRERFSTLTKGRHLNMIRTVKRQKDDPFHDGDTIPSLSHIPESFDVVPPRHKGFLPSFSEEKKKTRQKKKHTDLFHTLETRGNQDDYIALMKDPQKTIVVVSGVAGTGKTMLACFEGINRLLNKDIDRIIVTRPILGSDQDIGYLPGSLQSKMSPWTRPVMDYFREAASRDQVKMWVENGQIEIVPLVYMRGRTFKNSFIIADECQNLQIGSIKMLMTRVGEDSKLVMCGDPTQSDLSHTETNGFSDILYRLYTHRSHLKHISSISLSDTCIYRHPVIHDIMRLYSSSS